jgi:hypothetical protein
MFTPHASLLYSPHYTTLHYTTQVNKAKEQYAVEHDGVKLKAKRLKDTLNVIVDEVFALDNRKLQLQLSMKEREKELEVRNV